MSERDPQQFAPNENGAPLLDSYDEAGDEIERLDDDGWEDMGKAQQAGVCNTAARRCLRNGVPQFNFRLGDAPVPVQASVRLASGRTYSHAILRAIRKSLPICTKCMVMGQS